MGKPKTSKKPRIGIDNKKSPGSKKTVKKQVKKAERKEGKKESKEALTEKTLIANFIMQLTAEKYTEANKYLQKIVNLKLKAKIASCVEENLF
jgi:hypothetical protein